MLGSEGRNANGRINSTLARLKAECVPGLKEVEVLTRNGVEDFDTDCHTHDAIAAACAMQGFNLRVNAFDTEAIKALDGDGKEHRLYQIQNDGTIMIKCSSEDCQYGKWFDLAFADDWYCYGCDADYQRSIAEMGEGLEDWVALERVEEE